MSIYAEDPSMTLRLTDPIITAYLAERHALQSRLTDALHADPTIQAAWLWGSLGRGTGDALSDLDLWLITTTPLTDGVPPTITPYPALLGTPLVQVLAPQNAPVAGAYLLTIYPGVNGPFQIDWYWQAPDQAAIPTTTSLIVSRLPLPETTDAPSFGSHAPGVLTPIDQATQTLHFFWAMVLIAAKHVARAPQQDHGPLLRFVWQQATTTLAQITAATVLPPPDPALLTPAAIFSLLRTWSVTVDQATPELAAHGLAVPVAMEPHVNQYIDLVMRWSATPSAAPVM